MAKSKKTEQTPEERREYQRLKKIYATLPPNQLAVAEGLIRQAARLRVRLDALWEDLLENGETELFSQSPNTDPYERERPASRTFTATDKSYQAIIKQLNDICPEAHERDRLDEFRLD